MRTIFIAFNSAINISLFCDPSDAGTENGVLGVEAVFLFKELAVGFSGDGGRSVGSVTVSFFGKGGVND